MGVGAAALLPHFRAQKERRGRDQGRVPEDECEECGSGLDEHEEWCSEGLALDEPELDYWYTAGLSNQNTGSVS